MEKLKTAQAEVKLFGYQETCNEMHIYAWII